MPIITSKYTSNDVIAGGIPHVATVIEVHADGQHILTLEQNGDLHWQCERDGKPVTSRDPMDLLQWIADDAEASSLAEFAQLYPGFTLPQPPAGPVLVHVLPEYKVGRYDSPLFAHVATPPTHPLVYCTYAYTYPEATETGVRCGRCSDRYDRPVKHATSEHVGWCYGQARADAAEHAAELRAERGYPQHMAW